MHHNTPLSSKIQTFSEEWAQGTHVRTPLPLLPQLQTTSDTPDDDPWQRHYTDALHDVRQINHRLNVAWNRFSLSSNAIWI